MTEIKFKALWLLAPALIIASVYFVVCLRKFRHDMSPKQIAHSLFVGVTGGGGIAALVGLFNTSKEIFWNDCCNHLSIEFLISPPLVCLGLAFLAGHKVYKEFCEVIGVERAESVAGQKLAELSKDSVRS